VVPEFSVIVRIASDKPQLLQRKHFRSGEFTIDQLDATKYELQVSAATFVSAKLTFDFKDQPRPTDYCIVILHPFRSEAKAPPEESHSVSVKALQRRVPDTAREAYMRGVELHREGRLDEALAAYGTAIRVYPEYLEALTDIGSIFLLYNRPNSALAFLNRAKDIDANNSVVNVNIAVASTELGDYDGALKMLKTVLQHEPRLAHAQYAVAKIQYLRKKYDQAETYLRKALENDSALLDAWVLMIEVSTELKKYDQARDALQHVRDAAGNRSLAKFIDEQLSALGS
jgi:tetratricopeptide (TPR) repeat protein